MVPTSYLSTGILILSLCTYLTAVHDLFVFVQVQNPTSISSLDTRQNKSGKRITSPTFPCLIRHGTKTGERFVEPTSISSSASLTVICFRFLDDILRSIFPVGSDSAKQQFSHFDPFTWVYLLVSVNGHRFDSEGRIIHHYLFKTTNMLYP